ncbi:MAG: UbiX family flavin prenyltransferase [Eubacteriaceae bacterium]
MKKIIIGITGATGSIYAFKLIEFLIENNIEVHIIASENGKKVFSYELEFSYEDWIKKLKSKGNIHEHSPENLFANISSGSFITHGMIVLPCSMGTLGRIANGSSDNLIIRASDVCLKEKRPLILCVRETPYNMIHLKNMLSVTQSGGIVMPLSPSFYTKPNCIDDIVNSIIGRILDLLKIDNSLIKRWEY